MLGLQACVGLEAFARLLHVRVDASLAQRAQLERQAGQQSAILFQLVLAGGRDEQGAHTALYLHIPFCRTKCSYCDFNTYAGIEPLIPRYVEALCAEIQRYPAGLPGQTINFGGGTPSLLTPDQLATIIGKLRAYFAVQRDAEITIEANPGG